MKTEVKPEKLHKEKTVVTKAISRYFEGIGRRKTAVARVRIWPGRGEVTVNDKKPAAYFSLDRLKNSALSPLTELKINDKIDVSARIIGGGIKAQAEAFRHGLSRAITSWDGDFKKRLRGLGFLTRDSRMVERKKYGLKKARRAPQWKKR
ncbi:MAG: small subunit ribosomal protein S9 [Parcubacteria group bacterium Gr01-1014_20]|nr:MAG: small subunit ribosomal protein S9 [Parcubacteria group bacterium Gr01-1014_20]